jgi:hypothetical protein
MGVKAQWRVIVKMKRLVGVATLMAAAGWVQVSQAAVVLQDNFNSDPQMLNWTGDAVFKVVPNPPVSGQSSVDLIGHGGPFDFYPGNGNYLDLDGTTGSGFSPAGHIVSNASFGAGSYVLSFDLGGNARGAANQTTDVFLGGTQVASIDLSSADPLKLYSFSVTGSGPLSFVEQGPADQQGNILDNVTLSTTPLPATWSMLLAGFAGLGFFAHRGMKKDSGVMAAA